MTRCSAVFASSRVRAERATFPKCTAFVARSQAGHVRGQARLRNRHGLLAEGAQCADRLLAVSTEGAEDEARVDERLRCREPHRARVAAPGIVGRRLAEPRFDWI